MCALALCFALRRAAPPTPSHGAGSRRRPRRPAPTVPAARGGCTVRCLPAACCLLPAGRVCVCVRRGAVRAGRALLPARAAGAASRSAGARARRPAARVRGALQPPPRRSRLAARAVRAAALRARARRRAGEAAGGAAAGRPTKEGGTQTQQQLLTAPFLCPGACRMAGGKASGSSRSAAGGADVKQGQWTAEVRGSAAGRVARRGQAHLNQRCPFACLSGRSGRRCGLCPPWPPRRPCAAPPKGSY